MSHGLSGRSDAEWFTETRLGQTSNGSFTTVSQRLHTYRPSAARTTAACVRCIHEGSLNAFEYSTGGLVQSDPPLGPPYAAIEMGCLIKRRDVLSMSSMKNYMGIENRMIWSRQEFSTTSLEPCRLQTLVELFRAAELRAVRIGRCGSGIEFTAFAIYSWHGE